MHAAEPLSRLCLLVPGAEPAEPKFTWKRFRYAVKDVLKAVIGRPRLKNSPEATLILARSELISRIRANVPGLEVRYCAGLDDDLKETAADLRLDAIYLAMRLPTPRPHCALIGYVPDYQHRHLPHLFSAKELALRDEISGTLIDSSDAVVMNARVVAEDMRRFKGEPLPGLHALPFAPNLDQEWLQPRPWLLSAYEIAGPYFIVCNQFWMHKDHLTAFRAMAEVLKRRPDVTLVCTGGTDDYRDPGYFVKLKNEAAKLGLGYRLPSSREALAAARPMRRSRSVNVYCSQTCRLTERQIAEISVSSLAGTILPYRDSWKWLWRRFLNRTMKPHYLRRARRAYDDMAKLSGVRSETPHPPNNYLGGARIVHPSPTTRS